MTKKLCPLCQKEFIPHTNSNEELGNLTEKICARCIEEYNLRPKKTSFP
ncbi:MAG: hypothetical protein ACOC6H_00375 [Thermoproteota archaeon]